MLVSTCIHAENCKRRTCSSLITTATQECHGHSRVHALSGVCVTHPVQVGVDGITGFVMGVGVLTHDEDHLGKVGKAGSARSQHTSVDN